MIEIVYLNDMYNDPYFPSFMVDKVKEIIVDFENQLSHSQLSLSEIQNKLDEMTRKINDLEQEFEDNESEIETVARDSIGETIIQILKKYDIDIDIETALREREW